MDTVSPSISVTALTGLGGGLPSGLVGGGGGSVVVSPMTPQTGTDST